MMRKYPTRDEIIEEADDKQWLQRQRPALTDDYEGIVTESSHEQPASAAGSETDERWSYFRDTDGYYYIVKHGDVPLTIARTYHESVAAKIVDNHNQHRHCAAQLQFLANRAEGLSSLLAGMTTQRDGLREINQRLMSGLRFLRDTAFALHVDDRHKPEAFAACEHHACQRACKVWNETTAALNHAEQGEGEYAHDETYELNRADLEEE